MHRLCTGRPSAGHAGAIGGSMAPLHKTSRADQVHVGPSAVGGGRERARRPMCTYACSLSTSRRFGRSPVRLERRSRQQETGGQSVLGGRGSRAAAPGEDGARRPVASRSSLQSAQRHFSIAARGRYKVPGAWLQRASAGRVVSMHLDSHAASCRPRSNSSAGYCRSRPVSPQ